ncbi:hypothetical protein [Streptomyces sp. NPDC007991]|uniref:hypothetical protein n=1 Tax=Streptomyces sp. NPDC007991 TaxID=3364803 RepID=UPI0036EE2D3D
MARWEPLAAEQYVALDITGPPAGPVWAIPGALEQIIDNLAPSTASGAPATPTTTAPASMPASTCGQ